LKEAISYQLSALSWIAHGPGTVAAFVGQAIVPAGGLSSPPESGVPTNSCFVNKVASTVPQRFEANGGSLAARMAQRLKA